MYGTNQGIEKLTDKKAGNSCFSVVQYKCNEQLS